jgi:hypothetical protein
MGYTHYFDIKKTEFFAEEIQALQTIVKNYNDILQTESSSTTEDLWLNGVGEDSHEDFCVTPECNDFCKTNRKPYDLPVCECLLVLKHFNPDATIDSDGFAIDEQTANEFTKTSVPVLDENWNTALINVKTQFGFTFNFKLETSQSSGRTYYKLVLQ